MPIHLLQGHGPEQRFGSVWQFDGPHVALAAFDFRFNDSEKPLQMLTSVCGVDAHFPEFFKFQFLDDVSRQGQFCRVGIYQS